MKSTEQSALTTTVVANAPEKKARVSTTVAAYKAVIKKPVVKKTAAVAKQANADAAAVIVATRSNRQGKVVPSVTAKAPVKAAPVKAKLASKPKATESVATAGKAKVKKDVLVRDSFTMPQSEYQVLILVKKACLQAGIEIKKSELLRLAVVQLAGLSVAKIATLQKGLNKIQAGRPKK